MKQLLSSLIMLLSLSAFGQVYYKNQDLRMYKGEYITVYQYALGNTKGESRVLWACGHIKDSIDTQIEKDIKSAGLNFGKMEALTIKSIENHALRDSTQKIIDSRIETDFFNILSEAGFDFLKKDNSLAPMMMKKTAIITTNYTFKRKKL